ncbi:alpha/beta fold hydrolase [Bowmanella dokdonensis]|uniref:Proline iminopeptidase n=1 Tax=Bowmanella dokdonensis TaxID=751969 RepID=A0A939ISX1_9ALTE|nr:alpha/beta hydrolase [Bowmanella dokdonensis]MBN7827177.1 alpha/beta hydrolase [Bowmanella dokdonensis]
MKTIALIITLGLSVCQIARADQCPDIDAYQKAREVIADLGRIEAPNGVQASYKLKVGGVEQWLNVRGQDKDNPIILFVHGGPASPLTPSLWQFQRPLEEYFTMVTWDQRGAGKTYNEAEEAEISDSIHIATYVQDAISIAEHVRSKYHKQKLILMGHSWGTIVGMQAALERPDLFHAYVGIGQVINTRVNEEVSFDYAVQQATLHDNQPALEELQSIAPYPGDQPITRERIIKARKWAQFYGGLTAFRAESKYYYGAPRLSPEYSAQDICAINKGSLFTLGRVLPEFLQVDFKPVEAFPIPVVMFMGRHDYTTPSQPTAEWLEQVEAPYKKAVWFERSAHMVPWEEPGRTLVSLLEYVRPLTEAQGSPSL